MKKRFKITYQVITEQSARNGDVAFHGFLPKSGQVPKNRNNMPKKPALFTLKEAYEILVENASRISPLEADFAPINARNAGNVQWITSDVSDFWDANTGEKSVQVSLHLDGISSASIMRICKLFGLL